MAYANGEGLPNGTHSHPARQQPQDKIRVAIIGVGNCASSLVQGVQYYQNAPEDEFVPGLMHVNLGGYHIRDIEFSAAFDVDANKVGKDLSEAIWAKPNNTIKFADVPNLNVPVHRGMTHDGIGKYLSEVIPRPTARPPISSRSCETRRPMSSSPTCRWDPRWPRSGTSSRSSRLVARS